MSEHKITGAILVALPGFILNYIKENSRTQNSYYAAYFWLDDEKALYLHGNTEYGRSSGNFQGRFASQIGTQYFAFLEDVLEGETLLEAITRVESVQIDSKDVSWSGTLGELLELLGLV